MFYIWLFYFCNGHTYNKMTHVSTSLNSRFNISIIMLAVHPVHTFRVAPSCSARIIASFPVPPSITSLPPMSTDPSRSSLANIISYIAPFMRAFQTALISTTLRIDINVPVSTDVIYSRLPMHFRLLSLPSSRRRYVRCGETEHDHSPFRVPVRLQRPSLPSSRRTDPHTSPSVVFHVRACRRCLLHNLYNVVLPRNCFHLVHVYVCGILLRLPSLLDFLQCQIHVVTLLLCLLCSLS